MKRHVKNFVLLLRLYVTAPLLIFLNFTSYIFVELSFGSQIAQNFLSRISSPANVYIIRFRGGKVGKGTTIGPGVRFHNCQNFSNLSIGSNCHIGKEAFIDLRGKVNIGNNVVIAMRVNIITHFDMSNSGLSDIFQASAEDVSIGNDSYLGCNVTVLMGVNIGSDCVIGANTLMRESTAARSIYVGVPARRVKSIDGN